MIVQHYLTILRERWVYALSTAFIVIAGVAGFTALQTPVYESSANVFVRTDPGNSVTDRSAAADYARQQIDTYADLVTTPIVLDSAIRSLDLDIDAGQLADSVSADVPEDTLLISITARAGGSEESAKLANAVAESLQEQVADLETTSGKATVQLTVVTPATAPRVPASPNLTQNFVLGLIAAILAGMLAAVLRDRLDNKVRKADDIEHLTDAAVIGTVPLISAGENHVFVSEHGSQNVQAEPYRELRSNLRFLEPRGKSRSLLVTSSVKGEGKSVTSINLASALARGGERVLLVDADLRDPSVHRYLGIEGGAGLSTVLIGDTELKDVVQPMERANLAIIASSPIPPNPAELLDSEQMTVFLEEAAKQYDVVVLDSAPVLAATDAVAMATRVSGTVFVARNGVVRRTQITQALRKIQLVQARLLGIVLNGVPRTSGTAYSQTYGSSYDPRSTRKEPDTWAHSAEPETSHSKQLAVRQSAAPPVSDREIPLSVSDSSLRPDPGRRSVFPGIWAISND